MNLESGMFGFGGGVHESPENFNEEFIQTSSDGDGVLLHIEQNGNDVDVVRVEVIDANGDGKISGGNYKYEGLIERWPDNDFVGFDISQDGKSIKLSVSEDIRSNSYLQDSISVPQPPLMPIKPM